MHSTFIPSARELTVLLKGGEPATQKQRGFLHVLAKQHGQTEDDIDNLSKSEASEKIDELKKS